MRVKSAPRVHRRFSLTSVVVVVLAAGAVVMACADTKKTLGEECLKSEDCQSGICTSGHCSAAPPILDRDASTTPDAGGDAVTDAADAADVVTTMDAPAEAAPDAAAD